MKLCIIGINGKMGQELQNVLKNYPDIEYFGISRTIRNNSYTSLLDCPKMDVICDFASVDALNSYLPYAIEHRIPCVIATTGFSVEQEAQIKEASEHIPLFKSANFSYGVFVLNKLLAQAIKYCENEYEIDVFDAHHTFKKDSPSGTAKQLLNTINDNSTQTYTFGSERDNGVIPLHVVRAGNIVGDHQILFSNLSEQIELKHHALSKSVFAEGALRACRFMLDKNNGYYTMEDLI